MSRANLVSRMAASWMSRWCRGPHRRTRRPALVEPVGFASRRDGHVVALSLRRTRPSSASPNRSAAGTPTTTSQKSRTCSSRSCCIPPAVTPSTAASAHLCASSPTPTPPTSAATIAARLIGRERSPHQKLPVPARPAPRPVGLLGRRATTHLIDRDAPRRGGQTARSGPPPMRHVARQEPVHTPRGSKTPGGSPGAPPRSHHYAPPTHRHRRDERARRIEGRRDLPARRLPVHDGKTSRPHRVTVRSHATSGILPDRTSSGVVRAGPRGGRQGDSWAGATWDWRRAESRHAETARASRLPAPPQARRSSAPSSSLSSARSSRGAACSRRVDADSALVS